MQALSRKEIIETVKQSLINLGLEYIDLVIIHKCDPNCPVEGNFSLMESNKYWGGTKCISALQIFTFDDCSFSQNLPHRSHYMKQSADSPEGILKAYSTLLQNGQKT